MSPYSFYWKHGDLERILKGTMLIASSFQDKKAIHVQAKQEQIIMCTTNATYILEWIPTLAF